MSEQRQKRKRITLDVVETTHTEYIATATLARHNSIRDMIRAAIRIYQWYIKKMKEGYTLALVKDGKTIEVDLGFIP